MLPKKNPGIGTGGRRIGPDRALLARRAQVKIDAFATTLSKVSHGDIANRVPLTGSGDDLDDGGASQFVACIEQVRQRSPLTTIELLIPDFCGNWNALAAVMAAAPDVLNHNIETVPRLYRKARPQGIYERSLELLLRVREGWPRAYSKSGLMVGLGETDAEVLSVLADLRQHQVDIVTIGQYLSPGPKHLPVDRFVTPEQFERFRSHGETELGFLQVVSTPLTRSSYHAGEVQRLMAQHPR